MTRDPAYLYCGQVVHKRVRPRKHALAYDVFSILIDVDRIDEAAARSLILSRNRFNLFSIYDRDFGPGDGIPAAEHARTALRHAGICSDGLKIWLLAYPRMLGYVFNPLSVYFCCGPDDTPVAVIYEVNNTFGERKSYVVRAGESIDGVVRHSCKKELFVSPFAHSAGRYNFHIRGPGPELLVAILLRDEEGAVLKTHFRAKRKTLSTQTLFSQFARYPFATFKVIAGIHIEALRLWLKGVPVVSGHRSPRYSISRS